MFVLRMCEVADGIKIFGIAWRAADVLRRTTTGGLEKEGKSLYRRVVEPFFELDHMILAVAEVIETMDRVGAGLLNDIEEPRLAGIDRLGPKSPSGSGMRQRSSPACNSKRWLFVQPKRLLKRQMQPIQARGDRYDNATHHLRFHILEGHLDPDRGRVEAHAASFGPWACIL